MPVLLSSARPQWQRLHSTAFFALRAFLSTTGSASIRSATMKSFSVTPRSAWTEQADATEGKHVHEQRLEHKN